MTGWERMTSRCLGFLGEEVQNQKQQASNCGAKFSLLPRQMDLRYLNSIYYKFEMFEMFDCIKIFSVVTIYHNPKLF